MEAGVAPYDKGEGFLALPSPKCGLGVGMGDSYPFPGVLDRIEVDKVVLEGLGLVKTCVGLGYSSRFGLVRTFSVAPAVKYYIQHQC